MGQVINLVVSYKWVYGFSSDMQSMLPVLKELSEKNAEIEKCRENYKTNQSRRREVSAKKEQAKSELNNSQLKLSQMPEADIDEYFKNQFKGGILKEEYAKSLTYFKDLQSGLKMFDDGSALYEYVNKQLSLKAYEYQQLLITVKDAKIDVNGELKTFNANLKARRDIENFIAECSHQIEKAELEERNCAEKMEELRKRGEKLGAECSAAKARLADVFGEDCTDYKSALETARNNAAKLKSQKERLESDIEKLKKQVSENAESQSAIRGNAQSLSEHLKKYIQSATSSITSAGLKDITACKALIEKYGAYDEAYSKFNTYDKEFSSARSIYEEYKKYEGAAEVTAEQVNELAAEKERAETERTRLSDELAVLKESVNTLAAKLKEKREIEKEFDRLKHERDLIGRLKSLISANKFMEYIANEHLVNISRTASETLIELTDGRYFLEYLDNNFYVGDNYNGGERRKVKTLSGGETFLVSLSLALALSATICARSLKSIEFFFLDEGFGTLDGDLIETVLDALEKLKSANFTIGLISHVEELKHRITSKILVSKATETHGSTVQVSC